MCWSSWESCTEYLPPTGKENGTEAPGNSGFNVNVPEPTTAKLVDKKTAAYEKQQAEVEEESRMKSLEQLAGTLMNNGKSSDTGEKEKDGDRLQQSVNTYEQISGQLDDFYETPKETASGDLERKGVSRNLVGIRI